LKSHRVAVLVMLAISAGAYITHRALEAEQREEQAPTQEASAALSATSSPHHDEPSRAERPHPVQASPASEQAPAATPPRSAETQRPESANSSVTTLDTPAPTDPSAGATPAEAGAFDLATLQNALSSTNAFERIEGVERAVENGMLEALPLLEVTNLSKDPDAAPAIIGAIPELASSGDDAARDEAAQTLGRWLHEESIRSSHSERDARGNVVLLVEALGSLRSPVAVDALAHALDARDLPLHVETLIVQGLFDLADSSALDEVERFESRVDALPETSGLDEELRKEALMAARAARLRLGTVTR
jgi:hypothetical protein